MPPFLNLVGNRTGQLHQHFHPGKKFGLSKNLFGPPALQLQNLSRLRAVGG